ncbi:hypothetical protein M8J75_001948 [Diaphorina citri]|nr:hypothetical protein M8J75_001948 [Diaphorina citri]
MDEEEGQPEPLAVLNLFFPSKKIETFQEVADFTAECTIRDVRISHRHYLAEVHSQKKMSQIIHLPTFYGNNMWYIH